MLNQKEINLIYEFREAIDKAYLNDTFKDDIAFRNFPRGCCGDASDLLAHLLLKHGVQTDYICGNYYGDEEENWQSHAWLQLMDGTIIDITGDQFLNSNIFMHNDVPVYIGKENVFYQLFDVEGRDIRRSVRLEELGGFCYPRLKQLYNIIMEYFES